MLTEIPQKFYSYLLEGWQQLPTDWSNFISSPLPEVFAGVIFGKLTDAWLNKPTQIRRPVAFVIIALTVFGVVAWKKEESNTFIFVSMVTYAFDKIIEPNKSPSQQSFMILATLSLVIYSYFTIVIANSIFTLSYLLIAPFLFFILSQKNRRMIWLKFSKH